MKHNIIQMTAMAGLAVLHSINPIFQYIFDCLGFNPMYGNFDFVFQGLNRLWMVSPILLKPNVVHVIFFNFCEQKFVDHNDSSLLIFGEKWPNGTKKCIAVTPILLTILTINMADIT